MHRLERSWARQARRLAGLRLEVAGLEHVDPSARYVVAPLHESFLDVVALLHLPLDLVFVARDELLAWKKLGRHLRDSATPVVDPEQPVAAYRTLLRSARTVLDRGESLVVFPQGTILGIETAFQRGAFAVADSLGYPVLPVVLSGGNRAWEYPFSPRVRFDRAMRLEVLAPPPVGGAAAAMDDLQREMKHCALTSPVPPRRFVPERDGWWDGYRYDIDPAFPDLAARVARHRAQASNPPVERGAAALSAKTSGVRRRGSSPGSSARRTR
jgi:1-acyl-sn-glycerol-3-phosphate acyltransferase